MIANVRRFATSSRKSMTAHRSTASTTTFAAFVLVVISVFWGLNATASKFLYNPAGLGMDGIGLFVARSAWTLPIFLALALLNRPRHAIPAHDLWRMVALGVLFGPFQTGLFAIGVQHTSAAHVVMLFSLGPPIASVLGALMLRESISALRIVSLGVGIVGALVLMLTRSATGSHISGDAIILLNVVSFSLTAVLVRGIAGNYSPPFITGLYGAIGTALLVLIGLLLGRIGAVAQPLVNDAQTLFWFFGIMVVGLSCFAQIAQAAALRIVSASTFSVVTSYGSLLVGIITAVLILRERIGPSGILAGVILALALGLAIAPTPRKMLTFTARKLE